MGKPTIETIEAGTPEWDSLRESYLWAALESYFITGDYTELRRYVREGGDLDVAISDTYKLRELVAEMMGPGSPKHPTGRKDSEMIAFYLKVRERIRYLKYQDADNRNTVRAATKFVAENHKPHPIEFRTAEKRYLEGRKRFINNLGEPWAEG
jgi:hypothetical protein